MTAPWRCKSCDTLFVVQPDECVSCGSRKLYDSELKGAWADNERLRALVGEMRDALTECAEEMACADATYRRARAIIAKADEAIKETAR